MQKLFSQVLILFYHQTTRGGQPLPLFVKFNSGATASVTE